MGLEIFVGNEQSDRPVDIDRFAALARSVLSAEGVGGDAELSVLFVDKPTIAALNEKFLGHDGATDVLSFPIEDDPLPGGRFPDSGGSGPGWTPKEQEELPLLLGDVVICPAVAYENAPAHAGSYDDELALLLVHGILHLLGMDHELEEAATKMEAREQELLAGVQQSAPVTARPPGSPHGVLAPHPPGPALLRVGSPPAPVDSEPSEADAAAADRDAASGAADSDSASEPEADDRSGGDL